jgi:hypothetical protein
MDRMLRRCALLLITLFVLVTGCTTYEFDVTRPPELATHVARNQDAVLTREPLVYRLRAVENRLVMNIENGTDEPIQLAGDQSTVVDPDGQSHPLRSQAIAPHSFAKLILPPMRPVIRSGPTFGIGVGAHVGYHPGYDDFHDDWYHDHPQYFTVVDDNAIYWEWRGEGDIRLMLVFLGKDGESFSHEFVIRRVKV